MRPNDSQMGVLKLLAPRGRGLAAHEIANFSNIKVSELEQMVSWGLLTCKRGEYAITSRGKVFVQG